MSVARDLIIIVGPTASGKSSLALELAQHIGGEIISCDSMQIYCGCDIVTAKPTPSETALVPHHLIDICEPTERFSAARWAELANQTIQEVEARDQTAILCGGTGFYLRALLKPEAFDAPASQPPTRAKLEAELKASGAQAMHARLLETRPEVAEKLHPNDSFRVLRALEVQELETRPVTVAIDKNLQARARIYALDWPREELYARIETRVEAMLQAGALDELRSLREQWGTKAPALGGVGYKQLAPVLDDGALLPECVETWKRDTRRYAKRQLTWFRHQLETKWLDAREVTWRDCLKP